jgi:hypothetical protein
MMHNADPTLPERLAQVLADIEEYGLHIVHVLEDDADPTGEPRFSYTVGLWHSFEQPEVVVFGLPEDVAHELLNEIADEAAEGRRFVAGTRHDDLLQGYPVRFLAIDEAVRDEHCGVANWAYAGEPFTAVQLVYPDKQGRWPWDESTRQGFRKGQPVIGRREPA